MGIAIVAMLFACIVVFRLVVLVVERIGRRMYR
jgi:hypothetical protein